MASLDDPLLLCVVVMLSVSLSWSLFGWGIAIDEACTVFMDQRFAGAALIALNVAVCRELLRFLQSKTATPESLVDFDRAIDTCSSLSDLKTAIGDLFEWPQDLRGENLVAIDSRLSRAGLPTLSRMRSAEQMRFRDLLARGRITTASDARFAESTPI